MTMTAVSLVWRYEAQEVNTYEEDEDGKIRLGSGRT